MPGDLRDPEQSYQWYYDAKYDPTPNSFETGEKDELDEYLQSIVVESYGARLESYELEELKGRLSDKGALNMNPGDEAFRKAVRESLSARKVVAKWLTSMK